MLTPAQRLWADAFGPREVPLLQEERVLELVRALPDRRERQVVLSRYWERKSIRAIGAGLECADGKVGVSREVVRRTLAQALRRLKHPARRHLWEEARCRGGMEAAAALNKAPARR